MSKLGNKKLTEFSQMLRVNMTKEERHLWYDCLKKLPVLVHRQKVIEKYIVDFCIPSKMIVIEIDGGQHYEKDARIADARRDARLRELGYTVLRYTNLDINRRFRAVCEDVINKTKCYDEIEWL